MEDAKFSVMIDGDKVIIENLNREARKVYEEFSETFQGVSILNFILLSDSSMGIVNGELFYDVDLFDKEKVFDTLIREL